MNRHLSSEEISAWMIGERTPDTERHARECSQCRAEIDELTDALADFRDWYTAPDPAGTPRPVAPLRPVWVAAAALAASILIGVLLIYRPAPVAPQEPFVRIPYVAPLAPYERAAVVRMDVPVAALIAAGFEVRVPDTAVSVRADVMLGQDGRPYAIRPVRNSITNLDRRIDQ